MRLLNVNTEGFEEFIGQVIPRYAILSHTWEEEEVSYQDYISGFYKHKKGYEKIKKTIDLANQSALQYAWIDTCCIDKSSSAELTEAINSMYQWYHRSALCYVYLSDLELSADFGVHLSTCRWFSRGWTLQELIAPRTVWFYNSQWRTIGSKRSLEAELSRITRIPADILSNKSPISSALVAHKMSWAAGRQTTRVEDEAYCLLGIFNVNMPLLYGEGDKAFRRLQEEIIKSSVDPSIFAWTALPTPVDNVGPGFQDHCGILARSPAAFISAGLLFSSNAGQPPKEFTVTNKGLKTGSLLLYNGPWGSWTGCYYILPLSCSKEKRRVVGVQLQMISQNTFVRKSPFDLFKYETEYTRSETSDCYILIGNPPVATTTSRWAKKLWTPIPIDVFRGSVLEITLSEELHPGQRWGCFDEENSIFLAHRGMMTDCAGMSINFRMMDSSGCSTVPFECIIYIYAWTLGLERMSYTIVDSRNHQEAIREIGAAFTQWTDQLTLRGLLQRLGIPQCHGAVFEIPGLEGHRAYIYLVPGKVNHEVLVKCDVLRVEDVPSIERIVNWTISYN
ncbi:hypothetical protein P3342_008409 [Pyrenophora teres f. teres]|nr:hypothetical protein P3342_008409 [Pyrenophora teres f. teres]